MINAKVHTLNDLIIWCCIVLILLGFDKTGSAETFALFCTWFVIASVAIASFFKDLWIVRLRDNPKPEMFVNYVIASIVGKILFLVSYGHLLTAICYFFCVVVFCAVNNMAEKHAEN